MISLEIYKLRKNPHDYKSLPNHQLLLICWECSFLRNNFQENVLFFDVLISYLWISEQFLEIQGMSTLFSSLIQQIWLISIPGTVIVGGDSLMTMKEIVHSHATLSSQCPWYQILGFNGKPYFFLKNISGLSSLIFWARFLTHSSSHLPHHSSSWSFWRTFYCWTVSI